MQIEKLGSHFKSVEDFTKLPKKQSYFIRLDGKSFHTLTKNLKPFCETLHQALVDSTLSCLNSIQGSLLAYIQSDEISILCSNKQQEETQHWFGGRIQKIVSVSAALVTGYFNQQYITSALPVFDSRVIPIPDDEIIYYLIWRQLDCIRNSINKLGSLSFSKKLLFKKNQKDIIEMLTELGVDWYQTPSWFRLGTFIGLDENKKFVTGNPLFIEDPEVVSQILSTYLLYQNKQLKLF